MNVSECAAGTHIPSSVIMDVPKVGARRVVPTLRYTRTILGPSSSLVLRWLHRHDRSNEPTAGNSESEKAEPRSPRKRAKTAKVDGSQQPAPGRADSDQGAMQMPSVDADRSRKQPRCVPFVVLLAHQLEGCTDEMRSRRVHESVLEERIAQLDSTLEELSSAREVARSRTSRLREAYDGRIAEQEMKIRDFQAHRSNAVGLAAEMQKRVDHLHSVGSDISQEMKASRDTYADRTQVYRALLEAADAKLHQMGIELAKAIESRDDVRRQLENITARYKKEVGEAYRPPLMAKKSFRAAPIPNRPTLVASLQHSSSSASTVAPRVPSEGGAAAAAQSRNLLSEQTTQPHPQPHPPPPRSGAAALEAQTQTAANLRASESANSRLRGVTFAGLGSQPQRPLSDSAGQCRPVSIGSSHGVSPTPFGATLSESRGSQRPQSSGVVTLNLNTVPSHVEQLWAGSSVAKLKAAIRAETQPYLLAYLYSQLALKLRIEPGGCSVDQVHV